MKLKTAQRAEKHTYLRRVYDEEKLTALCLTAALVSPNTGRLGGAAAKAEAPAAARALPRQVGKGGGDAGYRGGQAGDARSRRLPR